MQRERGRGIICRLFLQLRPLGRRGRDEVITAATLSLYLSDDRGSSDGSDKLDLFLDFVDMQVTGDVQNDLVLPLIDLSLLGDGLLHVQLLAETGDFFFEGASLTPTVETREQNPGSDPIEHHHAVPGRPRSCWSGSGWSRWRHVGAPSSPTLYSSSGVGGSSVP